MKTAVYAPNWVGDAVMAFPFISDIFVETGAPVTIICKSWVAPVFEHHPMVSEIISFGIEDMSGTINLRKSGKKLKPLEIESIYLLSDSFRSAFLAWHSGAKNRIGFKAQGRSFLLTESKPKPNHTEHRSERYRYLGSGTSGGGSGSKGISLSESEKVWSANELDKLGISSAIGLCPFSVAESRTFPNELILDICRSIQKPLLIFGGENDREKAAALLNQLDGKDVKSICGEYNLRKSIALLSRCSGVIASDSGLGHIAANLGLPTVSVFGAGKKEETRPLGGKTAVLDAEVSCSPCLKNDCENRENPLDCLKQISTEEILSALDSLQ